MVIARNEKHEYYAWILDKFSTAIKRDNNSGSDCESAVTPNVIIALHIMCFCFDSDRIIQSLQEEEERPQVDKAHDYMYLCFEGRQ